MYDGLKHSCLEGNHIVNIFSFSKAYGMMGWRVGYVSNSMLCYFWRKNHGISADSFVVIRFCFMNNNTRSNLNDQANSDVSKG